MCVSPPGVAPQEGKKKEREPMKTTSKAASRIIEAMVAGLDVGEARKIDNRPGAFMAAHVERLTERCFSIAHYFEQNGDLVADPDLVVWRADTGDFVPVALQQFAGHYTVAVKLVNDMPVSFSPQNGHELARFANMMVRNIKDQQGGLAALRRSS